MSARCSKMDLCKGKLTKATRKGQNTIAPTSLSQAGTFDYKNIYVGLLKICCPYRRVPAILGTLSCQ